MRVFKSDLLSACNICCNKSKALTQAATASLQCCFNSTTLARGTADGVRCSGAYTDDLGFVSESVKRKAEVGRRRGVVAVAGRWRGGNAGGTGDKPVSALAVDMAVEE